MRLCLFVFLAACISLTGAEQSCPVTTRTTPQFVPPAPYRPIAVEGAFWHGSDSLWTQLPDQGVWRGLPHYRNGYSNKLFLWQQGYDVNREPRPDITLSLRRLDANQPLVKSRGGTGACFDQTCTMLTSITFPDAGCWEVTSKHKNDTLTFVILVQP